MSSAVIEVSPDVAEMIATHARTRGLTVDAYLRDLVENPSDEALSHPPPRRASLEEFEEMLDDFAKGSEGCLSSYPGTYSRDDIYFDHD